MSSQSMNYLHKTGNCPENVRCPAVTMSTVKRFGTLPKKNKTTVFMKLNKDGTYFQFQYDSCICMEPAAMFLPNLASLGRMVQKIFDKINIVLLLKLVALY